jgi:Family of unknown function (DUF6064)
MSEWWTYRLSDFLLFAPRTYYRLFELYNDEIWPAQIVALVLGAAIVALLDRGGIWPGRAIAAVLAGFWLFVAWAFHIERYATINWAAVYFAAGFAVQALLLIWTGVIRGRLALSMGTHPADRVGLGLFLFALAGQPAIGRFVGRPWTQAEVFGIAPDPTAVATLGLLLMAARVPWALLALPLLWCAITGATLWAMAAPDALVTPLAALLAFALAVWKTLSRGKKVD